MKLTQHIFFALFVCTLVVTSVQFAIFDLDDVSAIQLVEEQEEESNADGELISLDFYQNNLTSEWTSFNTYEAQHFVELHKHSNYQKVYISVPYSPPDLI